jgi:hypothetical protein
MSRTSGSRSFDPGRVWVTSGFSMLWSLYLFDRGTH